MWEEKKYEGSKEVGYISGILNILFDSTEFEDFFLSQGVDYQVIKYLQIKNKGKTVSILNKVEINEEFRGKGYGNELFTLFSQKSHGSIILLCDIQLDFVYDWYRSIGFVELHHPNIRTTLPIMLLD